MTSTVPKRALRDPCGWARALTDGLDDTCQQRRDSLRVAESLIPLADRFRELEKRRGQTSREIGAAKAAGSDAAPAIATMREIVAEARTVESDLRASLEALAARTGIASADTGKSKAGKSPGASVPGHFGSASKQRNGKAGDFSINAVGAGVDATDYSAYVLAHPARTSYHTLALRDLIVSTLGQESHHLIARTTSGTVSGVLPLVQLQSYLFGNFLVSMPWFNYGGPLADNVATSEALMQAAGDIARKQGCSHMEIRETAPRDGWEARTDKVSMTLGLPDTVDALERSFGASLRAQANKAERAGCTYRTGGHELLDDFYRVFSINMRDLGTPVQSRDFFDGLLRLFGDAAFLAVVSQGDKPLAVGLLLAHGDTLEIPWASSLRKANSLGVNMMLYRRTLGEAIARGYRHFDFGRSTMGGPTWRFKKQWGALPRQLYWHYWTADGVETRGLSPDNPKYRLAIAAWQRMPVALARRLGPPVVRGLP